MLYLIILCITLSFWCGCTRKNPHLFLFEQETTTPIKRLAFPSVQNLSAYAKKNSIDLSWQALTHEELDAGNVSQGTTKTPLRLQGYNLYCFTPTSFIPKQPLNQVPLIVNHYCDTFTKKYQNKKRQKKKKPKQYSYLVKAVFGNDRDSLIEGPSSAIVSCTAHYL